MIAHVHRRDRCRACGGCDLERVLHLPSTPLSGELIAPAQAGSELVADLDVYRCCDCATVQTQADIDVPSPRHRSSLPASRFARRSMQRLAAETWRRFGMRPGNAVIGVGAGAGYQLACFERLGARVLGVEHVPTDAHPVQAVVLTDIFDRLPDPLPILAAVRSVLDPDEGVVVIEVNDLAHIVDRMEACLFSHAHTVYLTVRTLRGLLARAGMRVLATDIVPEHERRATSLLVVAALEGSRHAADPIAETRLDALDRPAASGGFERAVLAAYGRLAAHVRATRAAGGRTALYGTGGRSVATLSLSGLGRDDVAYVCDRDPDLHGLVMPATHVPVYGPERLTSTDPVDELVVCSARDLDEIQAQNAAFTARGGRIVLLPDLLGPTELRAAA
jgi:C-methyltransferase C-terminal domain/Putative zinc binding domain